ncbi:MAG: hypothetical protein ACLQVG_30105 [Terriglobia bacterium]
MCDVADSILLDRLRTILSAPAERSPTFAHRTPEYVRFEQPPVVETIASIEIEPHRRIEGKVKYYDYGVVSVELELQFELDWPSLVEQSSRWIAGPGTEDRAMKIIHERLKLVAPALVKPYATQLTEDYYIVHLREASGAGNGAATAAELLSLHGGEIAQIVRGETTVLSDGERQEVLQSSISYYPTDLLVPGWTAALIYDSEEGAAPSIQLLEYANTQLLEFRHYDAVLTQVLKGVYRSLDKGGGFLSRWKLAREAERLNALRLEVTELTERIDNAIKFLSDMFYARLYRLAATKVGVPDYRDLVDEKLRTAGELYQFMVSKFHQARGFVLELGVVIILIIELIFLFKGKSM